MKLGLLFVSVLLLAGCASDKEAALHAQGRLSAGPTPTALATAPPKQLTSSTLRYSFIRHYAAGSINSKRKVGTPTGRGALPLRDTFGPTTTNTLTVMVGFRYSYANVPIAPGDVLTFDVAKPFNVGKSVMAIVDITDGGKTKRVYQKKLPPAIGVQPIWSSAAIPLRQFVGHKVTITFGAEVIQALIGKGGYTGAWVEFSQPGIYAIPARQH